MAVRQTTRRLLLVAGSVATTVVGMQQGLVPLVSRAVLDRERRFAPALWLPAPWWWLACLAVIAAAAGLLVALARARSAAAARPSTGEPSEGGGAHDVASAFVLLLGVYNGVAPFVARLVFDRDLALAVTLRLPSPWWWIVSLAVVVAAVTVLERIDQAKQRWRGR